MAVHSIVNPGSLCKVHAKHPEEATQREGAEGGGTLHGAHIAAAASGTGKCACSHSTVSMCIAASLMARSIAW